jgi:hypothetical protein
MTTAHGTPLAARLEPNANDFDVCRQMVAVLDAVEAFRTRGGKPSG